MAVLTTVLAWLGQLLGGPFAAAAVNAYKAKLQSDNSTERIAADLASRELAVQAQEEQLASQYRLALIGHWYEPVNLLAYTIVLYVGKIVVYDTMLGLGSTPAIRGDVATWMGMVMLFLVGKRGFENVARIISKK